MAKNFRLPFPIETDAAKKFWASRHICNRAKAIVAFSRNRDEALRLMRRYLPGRHTYHFRERAWNAWKNFSNDPSMAAMPFTPLGVEWWDCLPKSTQPKNGRWAVWNDVEDWEDNGEWIEWIENPTP